MNIKKLIALCMVFAAPGLSAIEYTVARRHEDKRSLVTKIEHAWKAWKYAGPTRDLINAVIEGNVEKAGAALKRGALINTLCKVHLNDEMCQKTGLYGAHTPLGIACHLGNKWMVRLLLQYGASPNCFQEGRLLPMKCVIQNSMISDKQTLNIVKVLCAAGAKNKRSATSNGPTPIQYALTREKDATALYLFEKYGSEQLFGKDSTESITLHYAVHAKLDTLKVILKAYADLNTQYSLYDKVDTLCVSDRSSMTPYHWISDTEYEERVDKALVLCEAGVPGIYQYSCFGYPKVLVESVKRCFGVIKYLADHGEQQVMGHAS